MTTNPDSHLADKTCDEIVPPSVICRFASPKGLSLEFLPADDGGVKAEFNCDEAFEGYPGILHGGVIGSILDAAMGNCMFTNGKTTVTAEMTIKFRAPVKINCPGVVSARIVRTSHPLYLLTTEIVQDGKVRAKAKGKYYDQPNLVNVLEKLK